MSVATEATRTNASVTLEQYKFDWYLDVKPNRYKIW